jgi:hypothetical protein
MELARSRESEPASLILLIIKDKIATPGLTGVAILFLRKKIRDDS